MRVVVIGATGNIGTSVLAALTADAKVSSIVAVARRPAESADPKVDWHALDVTVTTWTASWRAPAPWSAWRG